jgi:hypothetical protein
LSIAEKFDSGMFVESVILSKFAKERLSVASPLTMKDMVDIVIVSALILRRRELRSDK